MTQLIYILIQYDFKKLYTQKCVVKKEISDDKNLLMKPLETKKASHF